MITPGKIGKLALSGFLVLALSSAGLAQFGGGNKGGGKGGFNPWDPAEMFKKLAKDKDHIVISELDNWSKKGLEDYAAKNNITNGKITLNQYLNYSEEKKKMFQQGGFKWQPGGGGAGTGKPGDPITFKPGDFKPGDFKGFKPGDP